MNSRRGAVDRPTIVLVAVLGAILATAWLLRISEGRRAVSACDAAVARGDRTSAIVLARTAAEARCPGCASPDLGFSRLYAIAKESEGKGDDFVAVAAWRAVRAASLGSVVLESSGARRQRADVEITRLTHRLDLAAAAAGGAVAPAATEERLAPALATPPVASSTVFALLTLGSSLFLIGVIRFVRASSTRTRAVTLAAVGGLIAALAVVFF